MLQVGCIKVLGMYEAHLQVAFPEMEVFYKLLQHTD